MSDYDHLAAFLDLRQQPNGPAKKFALLKLFGEDLKEAGLTDTRNMSCAEIEQCVGDGFRECYVADRAAFAHELLEDAEGDVDTARGTFMRFADAFDPENGHQAAALFAAVANHEIEYDPLRVPRRFKPAGSVGEPPEPGNQH